MARLNPNRTRNGTPAFVAQLTSALSTELSRLGVRAEVFAERIAGTRVHRVYVIAPKFKDFKHFERQGLVWSVADKTLSADDRLAITTILTYTPGELKGAA